MDISVVIPAYNEEAHIGKLLACLERQDVKSSYEILVVDGRSEDRTREVVKEHAQRHRNIRLLDNPKRKTPYALNKGIRASKGAFVVVVGAHTEVPKDWLRRNREAIMKEPMTTAAVGGRLETVESDDPFVQAVEYVTSTFLGGGVSAHRYAKRKRYVLTTVFGMYRKEALLEAGLFDTSFAIGQDAELNMRLVKKGYKLLFDPKIRSSYHNRTTPRKLAKQMWSYGKARTRIIRKHGLRSSMHLLPSIITPGLVAGIILAAWWPITLIIPAAYLAVITGWSVGRPKTLCRNVLAYGIIHLCFSAGMVLGLVPCSRRR